MMNNLENKKIGGKGLTVEVDEAHLCTRKYNRGRILISEQDWIFGGICRQSRESFLVRVADRKESTLMPLLLKYVDEQSVIVTDSARVYQGLEKYGFREHYTVRHKKYFVHPENKDVHINTIERYWRSVKSNVRSYDSEMVDQYLGTFLYFERYFKNEEGNFINDFGFRFKTFLDRIKQIYTGMVKAKRQLPSLEYEPACKIQKLNVYNFEECKIKCKNNVVTNKKLKSTVYLNKNIESTIVDNKNLQSIGNNIGKQESSTENDQLKTDAENILEELLCTSTLATVSAILEKYNEKITSMIKLLRNANISAFDKMKYKIDFPTYNILHPLFLIEFHPVSVLGDGDCFYSSVSLLLFGDSTFVELIRLCTLYYFIKYKSSMHLLIEKEQMQVTFEHMARGISVSNRLFNVAKEKYPSISHTDIWADSISIYSCAIALGRPIYIYLDMRSSKGMFLNAVNNPEELSETFRGGFLQLANDAFAEGTPVRLVLYQQHYSPILSVVNNPHEFKPTNRTFPSLALEQMDLFL